MDTKLTYLGGATYLIEIGSFRFITDPGFDPEGTEKSEGPGHDLKKTMSPPIPIEQIGRIDAVFLSHAHHYDNLDKTGKAMLPKWGRVLTTPDGAAKLGGNAEPLETWESTEFTNDRGEKIKVTATPAVHTSNPEIRGAVGETTGFLLEWDGQTNGALYLSGDTVWIKDIEEIGKRYKVGTAILNMGAANVPAVGDNRLTMNGEEGARVTKTLDVKNVFPAHFEGWLHYKEGRSGIENAFESAGVSDRLHVLDPGQSAKPKV
jgi:L-ascorbate metabolism protein UlaG (beta-lactamase superfamily)